MSVVLLHTKPVIPCYTAVKEPLYTPKCKESNVSHAHQRNEVCPGAQPVTCPSSSHPWLCPAAAQPGDAEFQPLPWREPSLGQDRGYPGKGTPGSLGRTSWSSSCTLTSGGHIHKTHRLFTPWWLEQNPWTAGDPGHRLFSLLL